MLITTTSMTKANLQEIILIALTAEHDSLALHRAPDIRY